jgi:hypothetical protein
MTLLGAAAAWPLAARAADGDAGDRFLEPPERASLGCQESLRGATDAEPDRAWTGMPWRVAQSSRPRAAAMHR